MGAAHLQAGLAREGLISMEIIHFTKLDSLVGPLFLAASGKGLMALEFDAVPIRATFAPSTKACDSKRKKARCRTTRAS
jgi:hypothetical protein